MTKEALIDDVRKQLTWNGALPYSMPDAEISQEIDIAAKYFYDNWRYSIEQRYLLIPKDIFESSLFSQNNRAIVLPDCVHFVHQCVQSNTGGSLFGTIDPDFGDQKFIGSEIFLTPFIGESLMYRTIMLSFLDLTKAFSLDTIAYDYNSRTHRLVITGRNPKFDAVLTCGIKIPLENLYEDELFQRYVRAKAKLRLVQFLTAFNFQLPGGVTINYTLMTQQAQDEWNDVKEQMSGEEGSSAAGWMIFAHW